MDLSSSEHIVEYITRNNQATPLELAKYLEISRQAVHKQLKKLVDECILAKVGKPPSVFYVLYSDIKEEIHNAQIGVALEKEQAEIIDEQYLYVSPLGEMKYGVDGFMHWCAKTNQPLEKTAREYIEILQSFEQYKVDGLINGLSKFQSTFEDVYLDSVYYLDFYSIPRFGKTRLGQLLLYAKQSQNRKLIKQLSDEITPSIHKIIQIHDIDAIAFVPHTVKREVQFMNEFVENLEIPLPIVQLLKADTELRIPQKTLSKLEDRIENAKKTIFLHDSNQYKNVLLLDDAIGSGATLNETAKKLRNQNVATGKIIGLALTGSFKGFDVISEV